jgi:hypothetical protein
MLAREIRDFVLKKDKACGILQELRIGICFQPCLGDPGCSFLSLFGGDPGLQKQFAGALRLLSIEGLAPGEITCSAGGIRVPRNMPSFEMLAPSRKTKDFGGVWCEAQDPRLHPICVDEFSGLAVEALRIGGMSGVDDPPGSGIGVHLGSLRSAHRCRSGAGSVELKSMKSRQCLGPNKTSGPGMQLSARAVSGSALLEAGKEWRYRR